MKYPTTPVRLSHILRHQSVGSIMRSSEKPHYFMVIKDTTQWVDRDGYPGGAIIPYVEGVRSALGIDQELRLPPTASIDNKNKIEGVCIPACRFPSWMLCEHETCHYLSHKPWRNTPPHFPHKTSPLCPICKRTSIKQVQWVMIHADGHLADVPWHFLAHKEAKSPDQKNCKADWTQSYLKLEKKTDGKYYLSCTKCGASHNFKKDDRIPYGQTSRQPWLAEKAAGAEESAFIVSLNDTRIHRSESKSALVIPPESRIRKGSVVDQLYCNSRARNRITHAKNQLALKREIKKAADKLSCTKSDIEKALKEIENGYPYYGISPTRDDLFFSEYEALCGQIPDIQEDEDFVTEHLTEQWKSCESDGMKQSTQTIIQSISRLVSVSRLKEIQVLRGFKRFVGEQKSVLVPPDIVGESNWLPALELYGEGIFFTFDEGILSRWESLPAIQQRVKEFQTRFETANLQSNDEIHVSARFLLLHTISHLLIRQLETVAGYPAASLKERIYCSLNHDALMAGILIYVAVPDSVGSLGGLVEHAEPDKFLRLMVNVFEHAEWCSLDPVCSEHEGQGPGLLNKAACHGCALIPEPSCICGNLLLDRTFIKGNLNDFNQANEESNIPAFLSFVQDEKQ